MKNIFRKKEKRGALAITQIVILILSTIAFSYLIGSSLQTVDAQQRLCVSDVSGRNIITAPNVNVQSQTDVNSWCGFDSTYCTGEQGSWALRYVQCPTSTGSSLSVCAKQTSNDQVERTTSPGQTVAQYCSTHPIYDQWCRPGPCNAATAPAAQPAAPSASPTPISGSFQNWLTAAPNILPSIFHTSIKTSASIAAKQVAASTPALGGGTAPAVAAAASTRITLGWIVSNAAIAATLYVGIDTVSKWLGANPELAHSIAGGVSVGYIAATLATKIFAIAHVTSINLGGFIGTITAGWAAFGIGAIAAVIFFIFSFKSVRYNRYTFTCYPWDAPLGGANCQQCNTGNSPCTEYACRSLGQGCILVNQGTGDELCVWNNSRDVTPPVIQPWINVLNTGYKYIPDNAISPPDKGVKIVPVGNSSGCIAAFTPLTFGITLDEPAKCKLGNSNQQSFDNMGSYFNGSEATTYNHSSTLILPNLQSIEAENGTIQNGGQVTLYAKCQDANGNADLVNFAFKFCIDQSPDTTPPLIVTTSIGNGMPIAFNTTSTNLDVFTNEPATCKWSATDQSYNTMENNMSCSSSVFENNAQGLYKCSTILTGLKNSVDNNFYFRCKDQPYLEGTNQSSQRNVNAQSYKFTLKGTQPLVISSVGPTGTIKDSSNVIKVTLNLTTSAGYNEGDALCSFSDTGDQGSYIQFFNTGTYQHSQDLYLSPGDYTYYLSCTDLGGNLDTNQTSFTVESDNQPPAVVRAYHDGNNLKIVTDENASCVYGTSASDACNYQFSEGIAMQSLESNVNQIAWNPQQTFYIKCEDSFGNQPLPNECSIIASPFTINQQ